VAKGCALCEEALPKRNGLLLETSHWCVLVHRNQAYLGRCTVILKRHCESLSELNPDECQNLRSVVSQLESLFRDCFRASPFNWTCLMNAGYRVDPPVPHVHLHFRPRYSKPPHFSGMVFEDSEFGDHYDNAKQRDLPEAAWQQLVSMLRSRLLAPDRQQAESAKQRQREGDEGRP